MAEIKDLAAISRKWAEVTPQRDAFYKQGVENPKRDWSTAAAAANDTYKVAVKQAADQDRFAKGIRRVGEEKWKSRASQLGPGRFREGVQVAEADHQSGYAPYHAAVKGVTLPERFPTGDPRNIRRVEAVANAQHRKKLELLGVRST